MTQAEQVKVFFETLNLCYPPCGKCIMCQPIGETKDDEE